MSSAADVKPHTIDDKEAGTLSPPSKEAKVSFAARLFYTQVNSTPPPTSAQNKNLWRVISRYEDKLQKRDK